MNTEVYTEKAHPQRRGFLAMSREQAERIWQEDLAELTAENNFL